MDVQVKGVHIDVRDETRDFIDEKLEKISFAEDKIVSLDFTLTKEKQRFDAEAKIHFRWGLSAVIKEEAFDLHEALDRLIDSVELKVRKEKSKIKDHKDHKDLNDIVEPDDGL